MKKQNVKVGQLVKVKGNSNSHNYQVGETYRVIQVGGSNTVTAESLDGEWVGNNLSLNDIESTVCSKEYFENQIKSLQNEIDDYTSILTWMVENGKTEYDANEHKVWKALTTIENDTISKMDKVKLIASLLK